MSHVLVLSRVGMAFPMSLLWCFIHHVHGATWGQHVSCKAGVVFPMSPMLSLLSLLRDCAGQEEPPAQSPLHPNPLQMLLLPWPLGAACGCGDNAWPVPSSVPTHPSPVPDGLGTQLALLWQRPEVPECHHLLLHPCSSQCSAAFSTAEPSGYQAGRPQGPAALPVPGSWVRDKGHPVGLSLVLRRFPL